MIATPGEVFGVEGLAPGALYQTDARAETEVETLHLGRRRLRTLLRERPVDAADLLTAIVGSFVSHLDEGDEPMVVERHDGSLLLSGALPADALANRLDIELPDDREYATAAGYVLSVLKRLPREGESFVDCGWRFEIVDMDGRKIDKLLASKAHQVSRPGEADEPPAG